jgi:hypothetical protein
LIKTNVQSYQTVTEGTIVAAAKRNGQIELDDDDDILPDSTLSEFEPINLINH